MLKIMQEVKLRINTNLEDLSLSSGPTTPLAPPPPPRARTESTKQKTCYWWPCVSMICIGGIILFIIL